MIQVKNFILNHPEVKYLLVMNEPNLTDQANRTPVQAAADWIKYEQVIGDLAAQNRTVELVGPAMNWGTMTDYWDPVVWLDAFYLAYKSANGGRIPKIDYLAFHWYDYGLEAQLDRLQKYAKKIWITEMANWNPQINSYQKQAAQMVEMVNICETRSDVFRYAMPGLLAGALILIPSILIYSIALLVSLTTWVNFISVCHLLSN